MREYSTCMCTWSESEGEDSVFSQLQLAWLVVTAVLHNHIANIDISGACSGHYVHNECNRQRVLV